MKVDITSMFFNSSIEGQTATPAWRTSIGQSKSKECRIETDVQGVTDIVIGMTYKMLGDTSKLNMSNASGELLMCSVFNKIFINNDLLEDTSYILLLLREDSVSHNGRMQVCYSPRLSIGDIKNADTIEKMRAHIGCSPSGCWFVYDISVKNQDELHFSSVIVDKDKPTLYTTKSQDRSKLWKSLVPNNNAKITGISNDSSYLPYLTALRTKPFMLLAGISGTGKSRIVREMAKACWASHEEDYGKNCPRNFCMVQVKPNWHDSSDLIGYVSRINGEKYVVGPFLRFIAKAIQDPKRPYFLCLDEMNLAPVEQYFAEYLSVIESRKLQDGHIETDPIVPFENTEAYGSLIDQLFDSDEERKAYKTEEGGKRLTIPENLFVVGTVNMDETTFSFSRKVLDRAMTIEMNEVDLKGGLEAGGAAEFGYIGEDLMGDAAEGKDIYADNQTLCDDIITYLGKVNEILEGTPFKIAYRTRNEFLLYAVNRIHFAPESEVWQTLDEMTSMKILSRIEGDNERCEHVLRELKNLLTETVGNHAEDSASLKKIDEMLAKLKSGYTSYWA